jgi:hypothetical protein
MVRRSDATGAVAIVLSSWLNGWLLLVPAVGLDHVAFQQDGQRRDVSGSVVVQAQDGGLLLLDRDGTMWAVQPGEIITRRTDDTPFQLFDEEQLSRRLLRELPGFRIHTTSHYVICYNTTRTYAQWCGTLFERLHRAFNNYWQRRGLQLDETPPLVAVVFQDRSSYEEYGRSEVGSAVGSIIGYYSFHTNRIAMYDMTGLDELRQVVGRRVLSAGHLNHLLARPEAERTVATVIHEATHQLAFNSGLQDRFADIPVWLSEGIAIFFETPDLGSSKGWRSVGEVNRVRLAQFQEYLRRRPADSLRTLISTDRRFQDTATAGSAYAEAWALCYYLIRQQPRQFVQYLKTLREKRPLAAVTPEQRLSEFQEAFGTDLEQLDRDFLRQMAKVH